jgi:hypothetical protein
MSSRGRGEDQGGEHEIYPTPAWCVRRLLEHLGPQVLQPGLWLEPCAGYGAIIRAVNSQPGDDWKRIIWSACEIRPEPESLLTSALEVTGSPPPLIGDFLSDPRIDLLRECRVVLANVPFSLAEQFLLKCMALAPLATVVFLLRSNFIGGEERCQWLRDHVPDTYALPNRPQFRGEGSDSTEYSWMVWEPGAISKVRRRGYHEILEETPLAVRRRDKEEAISLLAGVEFVQREV